MIMRKKLLPPSLFGGYVILKHNDNQNKLTEFCSIWLKIKNYNAYNKKLHIRKKYSLIYTDINA